MCFTGPMRARLALSSLCKCSGENTQRVPSCSLTNVMRPPTSILFQMKGRSPTQTLSRTWRMMAEVGLHHVRRASCRANDSSEELALQRQAPRMGCRVASGA
jgi:hypothetical protein